MSNLWQRVANFFTEWDGEDMTKTMPLSVEDLRLVNSQRIMLTTLERERKGIRAKAIDEFAERLKEKAEEIMQNPDIMLDCKKCTIWKVRDIDEIAEQMKGGAT